MVIEFIGHLNTQLYATLSHILVFPVTVFTALLTAVGHLIKVERILNKSLARRRQYKHDDEQ